MSKVIQDSYTWNDDDASHDLREAGDEVGHVDVPADVLEAGSVTITYELYQVEERTGNPSLK